MKAVGLLLPFLWSLEDENLCSFLDVNHSIIRKLLPRCKITNLESRACLWTLPFTVYHSRLWWFTVSRSLFSLPKTAFKRIGWMFVLSSTSLFGSVPLWHIQKWGVMWFRDSHPEWKNPSWHSQRQQSSEGPEWVELQLHRAAWNGINNNFRENLLDISASALSDKVLVQHRF